MAISPQEFANLQALIAQQNQTRVLLEFKAGMMNLNGFTVTADPRRGTVRMVVQESLVHLQWTQRPGGQLENANDLLLFPGAAVWEHVPECKTGRVYLLRFLNSSRKRFFWMQEPSADKDDEYAKDINKYINNPPPAGNNMQVDPGLMSEFGGDDSQLVDMINQSHGHSAVPTTPPATGSSRSTAASTSTSASAARPAASTSAASATPASGSSSSTTTSTGAARPGASTAGTAQIPINVNNLANVLQQVAQQMQAQQQQQQELQDPLTLRNVLESDRVLAILNEDEKLVQSLLPHLPEGQRDAENLRATLRSPQLYQTLARMTSLLNSAQCGALMASLGLPVSDIGMRAFIKAVQDLADKESKQQSTPASSSTSSAASTSSSSASASASSTSSQSASSQSSSTSSSQPSSGSSSGTQSNNSDPNKKS